jgi:hypothetical protein
VVSLFDGGKDFIKYSGNSVHSDGNARLATSRYNPPGIRPRIEVNDKDSRYCQYVETDVFYLTSAYRKSLFWASLACITRPTNALIWIFLGLQSLYYAPSYQQKKTLLINAGLIV